MKWKDAKILIGTPTRVIKKYCLKEFTEGLKWLEKPTFTGIFWLDNSSDYRYMYDLRKDIECIKAPIRILSHTPYKPSATQRKRITDAYNACRDEVLDVGYDYLFSLESDVVLRLNGLRKLFDANKDVTSGWYKYSMRDILGRYNSYNLAWRLPTMNEFPENEFSYYFTSTGKSHSKVNITDEELKGKGIVKVDYVALGCCLISRKVLEEVKFRWKSGWCDNCDLFFSNDARKKGFDLYVHGGVKAVHYNKKWNECDTKTDVVVM